MGERLSEDPLDRAGFPSPLKGIVIHALKRGRNGQGYEQVVHWEQGEAILSPEDQEPLCEAVQTGDASGVISTLKNLIVNRTIHRGEEKE